VSTYSHLRDRLKWTSVVRACTAAGASIASFLSPPTAQEDERRRVHLFALLLIAVVATAKQVSGATASAPFAAYVLAIAVSAFAGGFAPACVATMAAVLLANVHTPEAVGPASRIMFALEGLGVAGLVAAVTGSLRQSGARLAAAQAANAELRAQQRRDYLTKSALQHLEDMAPDAAVFVVNAQGHIVEWSRSAERMYGYSAEQIVGSSLAATFSDTVATTDLEQLLTECSPSGLRHHAVHQRSDGTSVQVEFEIKACRSEAGPHFTVAAQDLSGRRETEAFREAALRAQVALQKAADDAQGQVDALEALTDPLVNPVAGLALLGELLEQLRSTMRADGVAVVELGQAGTRVISGAGLRPAVRAPGAAVSSGAADGRVVLVHNDAARVAQVSALTWPPTVSSIMVVPVGRAGPAPVRIEVVNERRVSATEWDLALARIVADRIARVIAFQIPAEPATAVAQADLLVVS
jgi:PAS domain S-box-containing protein